MEAPMTQIPPISGRGWTYLAIIILFFVLITLAVAARFWSRHLTKASYGWDDWFILAALIVYYGQTAFNIWVIRNGGLGHHVDELPPQAVENTFLQLTISQFIYAVLFLLIRFSICALFIRIFPQQWLRRTMYAAVAVNIAWALFVIISALTVCAPIQYNWDLTIPGGHCNNAVKLNTYIVNSAWTIIYDVTILCVPQVLIWRLKMPLATRAGVSMIMALGIFDIIVSIVRITAVVQVNFADVTYADFNAQVWTVIEISVGIIVACLPLCRWLIDCIIPRSLLPSTRRAEPGSSSNQYVRSHTARDNWRTGDLEDSYHTLVGEDDTIELTRPGHAFPYPSSKPYIEKEGLDVRSSPLGHTAAATRGRPAAVSQVGIAVERNTTVTYE